MASLENKASPGLPRTEMDALLLGRLDELTVSNESRSGGNSLLGILLSILVLSLISSLIVAAIFVANPEITASLTGQRRPIAREAISLEEAMLGELAANHFHGNWIEASSKPTAPAASSDHDELIFEESRNLHLLSLPIKPKLIQISNDNNNNLNNNPINNTELRQLVGMRAEHSLSTLVNNSSLLVGSLEAQGFRVSPSKRYLLIWTAKRRFYRSSSTARYFVYDTKLDKICQLGVLAGGNAYESLDNVAQRTLKKRHHRASWSLEEAAQDPNQFQLADWFSLNATQDALILIQANDIYLLTNLSTSSDSDLSSARSDAGSDPADIADQSENNRLKLERLTWDGRVGELYNGIPDWLYEEEILLNNRAAYEFSPSGQKLAFMSFDDSRVEEMPFTYYGDSIIPRIRRIRYPKAGRVNPVVTVKVADLGDPKLREGFGSEGAVNSSSKSSFVVSELTLPDELSRRQHYIMQIRWLTDDKLALVWLNRQQNESQILICSQKNDRPEESISTSAPRWPCQRNLALSQTNGWLDMSDELTPLDDRYYLTLINRHYDSDSDDTNHQDQVGAFKQVALVDTYKQDSFRFLSDTRSEVTLINGVDRVNSIVYFTATPPGEPGQRQVYYSKFNITTSQRATDFYGAKNSNNNRNNYWNLQCLTCDLRPKECLYNGIKLSPSTFYFTFECDGPGVPRVELHVNKLALQQEQGTASATDTSKQMTSLLINSTTNKLNKTSQSSLGLNLEQVHLSDADLKLEDADSSSKLVVDSQQTIARLKQQKERDHHFDDSSLIWNIEDNRLLRERLTQHKALPLTMRLQVPIRNSTHSASVLLLLPPQFGSRAVFRGPGPGAEVSLLNLDSGAHHVGSRARRSATKSTDTNTLSDGLDQWLENYLRESDVGLYTSQLTSGQQFPLVVDVYGGPSTQAVDFRYKINFGHYLASSRRIIYCMIDGRGSGFQGTKRMFEMYHKFGTVEIEDQIDTVSYLTRNFSFIDPSKVAIWGWSYGGFASAMALARSQQRFLQEQVNNLQMPNAPNSRLAAVAALNGTRLVNMLQLNYNSTSSLNNNNNNNNNNNPAALTNTQQSNPSLVNDLIPKTSTPSGGVFECAASVAPVTNWLLYDSAYTERYMSSPYLSELYDELIAGDHNNNTNDYQWLFAYGNSAPLPSSPIINLNDMLSTNNNNNGSNRNNGGPNHLNRFNSTKLHQMMMSQRQKQQQQLNSATINPDEHHNGKQQQTSKRFANLNSNFILSTNSLKSYDINSRYKQSSLLDKIQFVDRKRFLLIHGTADDNVHFQQSIMLMKRLIQANVMFESRLYPDQDHNIGNRVDKLHLGSTLSNFFAECFDMAL